ncbi:MAG: GNAT family N-acetyltransferase [Lachnospiraceae bacterium]|nr:GNAT family N-acetyltransferase [Lachnospiraceae bacterium]
MLYIKEANYEDIEKEYLFVRDMPVDENGLTNPYHGISREEFEERALPEMIAFAKGENLPEGYVPETFLFLWEDENIVGQFRIRHYLCESLRTGAGHIGYFIKKEFRGKGYGTEGLRLTLQIARNIVPEDEIYLRVNKDNPASLHVMLNNGGYIESENEDKYYVRIKK